jgi:hypothetical protein
VKLCFSAAEQDYGSSSRVVSGQKPLQRSCVMLTFTITRDVEKELYSCNGKRQNMITGGLTKAPSRQKFAHFVKLLRLEDQTEQLLGKAYSTGGRAPR